MEQKIEKLHGVLSNYTLLVTNTRKTYQDYTELAHWFYQQLLAPIIEKQKAIKDLIIVTDGALGHLPFDVFWVEVVPQKQTNYSELHYLLKDYNVSHNYSAALWYENNMATKKGNLLWWWLGVLAAVLGCGLIIRRRKE